jgi:hypothetical protein
MSRRCNLQLSELFLFSLTKHNVSWLITVYVNVVPFPPKNKVSSFRIGDKV